MNFLKRLKTFSKKNNAAPPVNTIKFEKQCPHCSSRGMFVFNDIPVISKTISELELKANVSLSLSKTDHNLK